MFKPYISLMQPDPWPGLKCTWLYGQLPSFIVLVLLPNSRSTDKIAVYDLIKFLTCDV